MDAINISSGDLATALLIFLFVCYFIAKSKYDGGSKTSTSSESSSPTKSNTKDKPEEKEEPVADETPKEEEAEPSVTPDSFDNRFTLDEDEGPKSENGRLKLY